MIKCSRCGVEIEDSFETCPNCGNELNAGDKSSINTSENTTCSQCRLKISEDSDFCPNCGNKLKNIQVLKCEECGSQIERNDLICSVCGSKINYPNSHVNCEESGQGIHSHNNEITPTIEENLEIVARGTVSILDKIILFFKRLFGGNS